MGNTTAFTTLGVMAIFMFLVYTGACLVSDDEEVLRFVRIQALGVPALMGFIVAFPPFGWT